MADKIEKAVSQSQASTNARSGVITPLTDGYGNLASGSTGGNGNQGGRPSMLGRLWAAIRNETGLDTQLGPGQPTAPILGSSVPSALPANGDDPNAPRVRYYPPSANMRFTPRSEEPQRAPFELLRSLSLSYDIVQLCNRTLCAELGGLDWQIQPKDGQDPNNKDRYKSEINSVTQFITRPDNDLYLDQWSAMLLTEDLEVGAPAVYKGKTRRAKLGALEIVQGDTIKPVIDYRGKTIAYQQVWRGLPSNIYPKEAFVYQPRIRRRDSAYGVSPVELIMLTINTALRRQTFELGYYTKGNVPRLLVGLDPAEWKLDQIQAFQEWWDSLLEGDDGKRNQMLFYPGDPSKPKEFTQHDPETAHEQWALMVTCAIYGVNPEEIGFTFHTNRATAESQAQAHVRKGIIPVVNWMERVLSDVIQNDMGYPMLAFKYEMNNNTDSAFEQAQADSLNIKNNVYSPGYVRERDGVKLPDDDPVIVSEQRNAELSEQSHKASLEGLKALAQGQPPDQQPGQPVQQTPPNAANPAANVPNAANNPPKPNNNAPQAASNPQNAATKPKVPAQPAGKTAGVDEVAVELRRWREKSLGRVKVGKSALCDFESEVITGNLYDDVRKALAVAKSADDVRVVFMAATH